MRGLTSFLFCLAPLFISTFPTAAAAQLERPLFDNPSSVVAVSPVMLVDHTLPNDSNRFDQWREQWVEAPAWGGRIGYVDVNGNLFASVTLPDNSRSKWVLLETDVADFQIMDWRIAVLKSNGKLMFAEGPLSSMLKDIDSNVSTFQMALTRLGYTKDDGRLFVKEHGFLPRLIATHIASYHIGFDKVGVLTNAKDLYVNVGGHIGSFMKIARNVDAFQLEREWIGIIQAKTLKIGKWGMSAEKFIGVGDGVSDFELEVSVDIASQGKSRLHVAAVDASGRVSVGESAEPTVAMHVIHTGAKQAHWSGRQLLIQEIDGATKASMLLDDASQGVEHDLGKPMFISANQEGAILVHRGLTGLNAIRTEAGRMLSPRSSDLARLDKLPALDASVDWEEKELQNGASVPAINKLAISSIRPDFTRRAIHVH